MTSAKAEKGELRRPALKLPRGGVSLRKGLSRATRIALAALFVVTLVPGIPTSQVEEAEAATGTTNYSDYFKIVNRFGSAGSVGNATLRAASTNHPSFYSYLADGKNLEFFSGFHRKEPPYF